MNFLTSAVSAVALVSAIVSVVLALYFAWCSNLKISLTFLLIFIVAVFLGNIGIVEVFKALNVEVRLNRSVDRADKLIKKLENASIDISRIGYLAIASSHRPKPVPFELQNHILQSISKNLEDIGLSPEKIKEIQRPYVSLIGYDLIAAYKPLIERRINSEIIKSDRIFMPSILARYKLLHQINDTKVDIKSGNDLSKYLCDKTKSVIQESRDRQKLCIHAETLGRLFDAAIASGGYTAEVVEYIDNLTPAVVNSAGPHAAYRQIFDE